MAQIYSVYDYSGPDGLERARDSSGKAVQAGQNSRTDSDSAVRDLRCADPGSADDHPVYQREVSGTGADPLCAFDGNDHRKEAAADRQQKIRQSCAVRLSGSPEGCVGRSAPQ